jgi:hypothetical protein
MMARCQQIARGNTAGAVPGVCRGIAAAAASDGLRLLVAEIVIISVGSITEAGAGMVVSLNQWNRFLILR